MDKKGMKEQEKKIKYCYCIIEYEDGSMDAGFLSEFEKQKCTGKVFNVQVEHDILAKWYPRVWLAFMTEFQAQQKIKIMKKIVEDAREFMPVGNPILDLIKEEEDD